MAIRLVEKKERCQVKIIVYSPIRAHRRGVTDELLALIREAAGGHPVVLACTPEDLRAQGADAVVLYGSLPESLWDAFPRLRWLQSQSAGVEAQLYPAFLESDVILTNAKGIHAPYCAEHAFALLLGLTRGLQHHVRDQDARQWRAHPLIEIGGWTLGLIGLGGFGREMAQRGKGFGMHVIGYDPYCRELPAHVDEQLSDLDDLLRRSDVVMIACPHTPQTHHLIDARALALLKPSAYLISVTRGGVVDEGALIEVLQQERIAGAGLDVFEQEPLPEDSPLWELDNVILTPHAAGRSQNRPRPTIELFCDNIRRFLEGRPLRNVVDKQLGF
jgi:phosphoglycerate dehydrogenase-like enzyme